MSTLNESQRRRYAATLAMSCGCHGVCKVSDFFRIDKKTVYFGIEEYRKGCYCEPGRIRRRGGGRKRKLSRHPEWISVFRKGTALHTAGLPQDECVVWVSMSVPEITAGVREEGCEVSDYIVRQIIQELGFKHRSFYKGASLKEVPLRDEQFKHIHDVRTRCMEAGKPVLSINT